MIYFDFERLSSLCVRDHSGSKPRGIENGVAPNNSIEVVDRCRARIWREGEGMGRREEGGAISNRTENFLDSIVCSSIPQYSFF